MRRLDFIAAVCFAAASLCTQDPHVRTQPTQQDRLSRIFAEYESLGREINPGTPDWLEAQRRAQAGQDLAVWTILLQEHHGFQNVKEQACDALWRHWPWIAESLRTCQN